MPRLVTFGCSFVYGHFLPDCNNPNGNSLPPSKFAWPQLLADKLGYECHNFSKCGSGNLEIFMKVLSTKFLPDDLVIIAWSFFSRFDHYQFIDLKGNTRTTPDIVPAQLKINEYYPEKNYWDNWLIMQNCELFLNSKNIKNFSYIGINFDGSNWTTQKVDVSKNNPKKVPELLTVNNMIEDIPLIYQDFALDRKHPGAESHRLQADLIYNKIIDKIK